MKGNPITELMVRMSATVICFVFPQPTRLNVFKNDQDTWDYTNPNLGGPGKSPKASIHTFINTKSSFFFLVKLYFLTPLLVGWERAFQQLGFSGTMETVRLFLHNATY